MADRSKTNLRLLVNSKPFSAPGFRARMSQCSAELTPVVNRLCDRYPLEIVFAALLAECEDASLAFSLRGRLDANAIEQIFKRLQMTIERAGPAAGGDGSMPKREP